MPPRDFTPDSAIMLTKVDDPGHLNARVVLHLGEEPNKYKTAEIRSFTFERMTNGIGCFTLSLVDSNWVEIERNILNAKGHGFIQYGYENALNENPIKVQIIEMELEPYLNYVVLNISGLCLGHKFLENSQFLSSVKQTTAGPELTTTGVNTVKGKNRPLHEFVIDLAKSAGFTDATIDVDRTTIPIAKDDLFGTEDASKIFNSKGMNLFTFLIQQILPYAITPEDSEKLKANEAKDAYNKETVEITPFVFYISKNANGEEVFHFHKKDKYKDDPKLVREFNIYSDPETRVISYRPSYEHMIANIVRGTSVFAWTYSPLSGTEYEESNRVEQSPSAVEPYFDYYTQSSLDYSVSAVEGEKNSVSKRSEASKIQLYCPDPNLNKLLAARSLQMSTNAPLTAELVLTGDPSFNICDCIDINVNIPFGSEKGRPHSTSNRYIILGILDSIDMGVFTTTLQLGTAHGTTDRAKQVQAEQNKGQDEPKRGEEKAKIDEQKKKLVEQVDKSQTTTSKTQN